MERFSASESEGSAYLYTLASDFNSNSTESSHSKERRGPQAFSESPPSDFHPDQFARAQKCTLDLEVGEGARDIFLPVLLVGSQQPGRTLVATAVLHGDEYEGVRAILDVFHKLGPGKMSRDFLAVPVANPPAFWNGTRTNPLDGGNLA